MKYARSSPGFLSVFTSNNLNGIMAWLMVLAVIGVVRMILAYNQRKKAGISTTVGTYALGPNGETHIVWSRPAKALLLGIISITFFGAWMWLMEGFMGIDYQVWSLSTYVRLYPPRIIKAIPYMCVIFIAMFTGNMNQRILPPPAMNARICGSLCRIPKKGRLSKEPVYSTYIAIEGSTTQKR